jgi:hypothetical protein
MNEALVAAAAVLSEISQHNGEAEAINPHLPDGCERIPIFDVQVTHIPGESSLVRALISQFSNFNSCFPQSISVNPPGPAAYPQQVKAALAKLEETRRARIGAARGAPRAQGNAPEPGSFRAPVVHALPPREPELAPTERAFRGTRHFKPGAPK